MTDNKLAEALRRRVSLLRERADDATTNKNSFAAAVLRVAADQIERDIQAHAAEAATGQPRSCTCHPDDSPPVPCPQKFAYSECAEAAQAQAGEPVAVVERNVNGQIRLATPSGDAFDMSRYIGARLYTHPQPAQDAKGCVWSEDEEGNWDTGCGNMFVLTEGTPHDNEMGFCCYCGGKLDQVTQADAAMAKEGGR